mgnify:FL=1
MAGAVLIIDDSEVVRSHVQRALSEARVAENFIAASDGLQGFKLLLENHVDLVLCDVVMPGMDGFKFLGLKHSKPQFQEVPVIMLTGHEDVRAKVRCLEAGASDYLTKPFHDEELVARVRVHLKMKTLQDELREKNRRLEELSRTDALTKLFNRRHFMELLRAEYSRAKRYGNSLSYVMVDVDRFKDLNDTYGHVYGDQVLKAVGEVLRDGLRQHDMAGRYGGEEFALMLPQTSVQGATAVAERCREVIEARPVTLDEQTLYVTASFGVASIPDPRVDTLDDLIRLADEGLYAAKEGGRNRVVAPQATEASRPTPASEPTSNS